MQTELRDGTLHISGDVTVKTLTAAAFTRFRQQCRLKDTRAVDLSGVGRADSACVYRKEERTEDRLVGKE